MIIRSIHQVLSRNRANAVSDFLIQLSRETLFHCPRLTTKFLPQTIPLSDRLSAEIAAPLKTKRSEKKSVSFSKLSNPIREIQSKYIQNAISPDKNHSNQLVVRTVNESMHECMNE